MSKSQLSNAAVVCLLWLAAACAFKAGHATDAQISTAPTVLANSPINGAIGVPLNGSISATFSEQMNPSTLTASTFTLTAGATAIPVSGTVSYADSTVVFTPTGSLASDGRFTATITIEAKSASGVALATEHVWSFTGDTVAKGPPAVNLGTAGSYAILAKSAISGTGATVTGNLGVSPAFATSITGFSLIMDGSLMFWTSAQVTGGRVYAADNAMPTPANLAAAVSDMAFAISDAAGRAPDVTALGADIGGMVLVPGVYHWNSGVTIPANVTLTGAAKDVWIFQIAQDLNMTASMNIVLTGGALSKNVFWQVSGAVNLGAMAHFEGIVLTRTAVTSGMGTLIHGRLLAQTAVTITGSTVVEPKM